VARHIVNFPDLVIPNAGKDSNVISSKTGFGHAVDIIITTAAALTGVVTLLVGPDEGMAIGALSPLYVDAADVTLPAGKSFLVPTSTFKSMAVQSGSAEGAARTFIVRAQVQMVSD